MKTSNATRAELIAIIDKKQSSILKLREKNKKLRKKKATWKVYLVREGSAQDDDDDDAQEQDMLETVSDKDVQVKNNVEIEPIEQGSSDTNSLVRTLQKLEGTIGSLRGMLSGSSHGDDNDQGGPSPEAKNEDDNLQVALQAAKDTNQRLWHTLLEILKYEAKGLPKTSVHDTVDTVLGILSGCPKHEVPTKLRRAVFDKIWEGMKGGGKKGTMSEDDELRTQELLTQAYAIVRLLTIIKKRIAAGVD